MNANSSDVLQQTLWVGRFEADGDILVYDATAQTTMPEKVRLFSTSRGGWRVFRPDVVRSKLGKVNSPETIRSAVQMYTAFEADERDRLRQEHEAKEAARETKEAARAERERQHAAWVAGESIRRRDRARSLNLDHLSRLGIKEMQYRLRASHLPERKTPCWACKRQLDSQQDLEHVLCGWIVCTCGACGCGYPGAA